MNFEFNLSQAQQNILVLAETSTASFKKSPINCSQLNIYGVCFVVTFTLGLCLNSFVLLMYCVIKEMRSLKNSFMIALIISNLASCLFETPILIISTFNCRFIIHFYELKHLLQISIS